MAFLSKLSELGGVISSKSQEAANKAKELGGVAQINAKINSTESNLRQAYTELGEKIFKECPEVIQEKFPELFERMDGFRTTIEQYNEEISGLKQATADKNAAIQEAQRARVEAAQQAAAEEAARKAEIAAQAQAAVSDASGQAQQTAENVSQQAQQAVENVSQQVQQAAETVQTAAETVTQTAQSAAETVTSATDN